MPGQNSTPTKVQAHWRGTSGISPLRNRTQEWLFWWKVNQSDALCKQWEPRGRAEKGADTCLQTDLWGLWRSRQHFNSSTRPEVVLVGQRTQPPDWLGTCGDGRQWWQKPGVLLSLSSNPVSIIWWVDSLVLAKTVVVIGSCLLNGTSVLYEAFALNFYQSTT